MSRRSSKVGAATSRRTRRGEHPQLQLPQTPAFAATGSLVSNPIFLCEDGSAERLIKPGGGYRPGSLHALVRGRDVPDGDGDGGKLLPLPLPPSRAHHEGRGGTRVPAWHVGPTIVVGPHGAVLRMRAPPPTQQHDPFLAAYVACAKGRAGAGAGKNSGQAKKKKKKKAKVGVRGGCGMWNGWASGAAGVISCRHRSAVTVLHGATPLPAAAESPAHPTLDLSRLPAVLPGRRRPQD